MKLKVKLKLKLKTQIFNNTAMKTSNLDICTCIMLTLWKMVTCNTCEGISYLKFAWNVTQAQVT